MSNYQIRRVINNIHINRSIADWTDFLNRHPYFAEIVSKKINILKSKLL